MKATLSFDLPEERTSHLIAIHADSLYATLSDLDHYLRNHVKHGSSLETADQLADLIRKEYTGPALSLIE